MKPSLYILAISLALFACSDKPSEQSGVQDFPNTLQASSREALFDLPTSLQSESSGLLEGSSTYALARVAVGDSIETDADKIEAFKPYLAVPLYIHLAEEAKIAVQNFILDMSKNELPPKWEGKVDSLYVKTLLRDTTLNGKSGIFCSLKGLRNDTTIISLQFFRSDSNLYRGHFYLYNPADHQAQVRVEFDGVTKPGEQSMTVLLKRDSLNLEDQNDLTMIRIHAIKKASGRIVVTGSSYHPLYTDEFWGDSPKIYAFQAVSHPEKNRTLMRVAFGDADSLGPDFFVKHSVDQGVLRQVTKSMQQNMRDSASWNKLIYFSLDSGLAARDIFVAPHYAEYLAYEPTRTPDDFTSADLEAFLDLNRESILNKRDNMENLRALYFLVKIKQPIFLANDARIVGSGPDGAPKDFPLPATALTDEDLDNQSPEAFSTEPLEE